MVDTKISGLPSASSVGTSDLIPVVQGGVTKQATIGLLPTGSGGAAALTGAGSYSRLLVLGHSYGMGDQLGSNAGWLGSASITAGSTTLSSPNTFLGSAQVGQPISGVGITVGSIVTAVSGGNPTTMSLPATATRSPSNLTAGDIGAIRWGGRVSAALHARVTNMAKNGARAWLAGPDQGGVATALYEIVGGRTAAPYLPREQLVGIITGINDLGDYDNLPRLIHAIRTTVARVRSAAIFENTHGSVAYNGTWTQQSGQGQYASAGTNAQSPSNPTSAGINITMPADFPAGSVAHFGFDIAGDNQSYRTDGVYQLAVSGATKATLDTRNLMGSTSNIMAVVARVAGLAAGQVVNITFPTAPAGNVFFDYWAVEAPIAPLVLLLKQPLLSSYALWSGGGLTDAKVNAFNTALDNLAAEFTDGRVVTVDLSALNKSTTLLAADNVHPNELGHYTIATQVLAAIQAAAPTVPQVVAYTPSSTS